MAHMTKDPSYLKDPAVLDESISPREDFFRHANGQWLTHHEIPADRPADGEFYRLRDEAEAAVREIIEALDSSSENQDEAKMARLYAQFMDTDSIETAGTEPLRPDLKLIEQAQDKKELANTMGRLNRTGVNGLIGLYVESDLNDPTMNIPYLTQAGIGLPDEAYYREDQYGPIRDAYVELNDRLAQLAGLSDSDFATNILKFETQVAKHHWDNVTCRDAQKTNNPTTWAKIKSDYPQFPWQEWLAGVGFEPADDGVVNVGQPPFLEAVAKLWEEEELAALKRWLTAAVLSARAAFLPEDFVEAAFAFKQALTGAQEQRPRWKRGVSLVEASMGEALGQLYVAQHFPPEHKQKMLELVDTLIEAYRDSITNLTWMGEETKARALDKLEAFTPKIGYPDKWRSYEKLAVGQTLLETVRNTAAFDTDYDLEKVGKPVDPAQWFMTPQTVNAYYHPLRNEIVFPAAILQPPFFDPDVPDAVNYGGIGAVIGHEIGHGFDDQGSQYDGQGKLNNWWTDRDRAEFETRTKALIEQYNQYSPAQLDDSHRVNGAFTIGENIGDLGGASIAWKAYLIELDQRGASLEDEKRAQMSAPEQFFYSWARIWRAKTRDEMAIQLLAIDPHSPSEFRCNGVLSNLDLFYETFGVEAGDAMWIDPSKRVTIW
ncbi:M13 family metallopeptidase [Gleimia hominis]|uniref:M13 family metallopeptidase n=1 Tax=Gleimia hominis TaxID=595468 RepID=UPI0026DA05D0